MQVHLHLLYRTFGLLIFLNASMEKEGSPPLKPKPLSSSSCLGFCRSSLEFDFFFFIFSLYVQSALVDPWVGTSQLFQDFGIANPRFGSHDILVKISSSFIFKVFFYTG